MWRDSKLMKRIAGLIIVALLLVLAYAVLATYNSYTKVVIQQQQEHLLVISRSVAQNMELFLPSSCGMWIF